MELKKQWTFAAIVKNESLIEVVIHKLTTQ